MVRFCLLFFCLLVLRAGPVRAADSPFDRLGGLITPLVNVFSAEPTGPERALSLHGRLDDTPESPGSARGAEVELAVEYPDKLRLHGVLLGQEITLARRGNTIWVHPGSVLKALLEQPKIAERLPEPNRSFKLKKFKLPLSAKELFFLPALFQAEAVEGEPDAMDVRMMPALAGSLKMDRWQARITTGGNGQPKHLVLTRPSGRLAVTFDRFQYAPALPPETWVPTAAQQADVMLVPPVRYDQLARALLEGAR